eukprot:308635_1
MDQWYKSFNTFKFITFKFGILRTFKFNPSLHIQIQPKFTHSNSGEAEPNDGRDIKDLIWKEQNQFTPSQINGHIQYLLKQLVYHYIWQSWFTYKIMIHIIYEQELTKTEWNQIQHTWYKFAHSNPTH